MTAVPISECLLYSIHILIMIIWVSDCCSHKWVLIVFHNILIITIWVSDCSTHKWVFIIFHIYIYKVYKDHHVMTCVGNRVNLHLCLTILTILRKSWFYQNKIIVLSLSCHSPERWQRCEAVLRSSTPEIYSLLVHMYSGVAQSTVCAIPPAMLN